jgi:fructose-1,6-bisphosphatase I
MTTLTTLSDYLLQQLADHREQKDLLMMMSKLATIGEYISSRTSKAGIVDLLGAAGSVNIQGESVQKLDVFANNACKEHLKSTGLFAAMASEEEDTVVDMAEEGSDAKYIIAFDPLDGSSNIDVNVSIGTIFSVHRRLPDIDRLDEKQFFQKGRDQVLAGYILYGSSTVLVFSFGNGVHEFTLDPTIGEFFLSNEKIVVPEKCQYYSVNEGNKPYFQEHDKKYIDYLKYECGVSGRYIGSLVADFHRNLIKGGVFLYPRIDKKGSGEYKGKLRLNYELKPMAFLLEQAGGMALDGAENILDIIPTELHERRGIVMGSRGVVKEYDEYVQI